MAEPLRKSIRVACGVDHAFETFTQRIDLWWPLGHRKFENSKLHLDHHAGGRFYERTETGEEFKLGEVLACRQPDSISFTWYPGAVKEPTRVDITFTAEGDETLVNVLHTEAESALGDQWPKRVALFTRGWDAVLAAFSAHVESQNS